VPSVRSPAGRPAAASSSAANAGQRRTAASPSSSKASSPGHASVTGASMPPATHDAPEAGAGSRTVTRSPASATRQAQDRPITPAPITVNEFDIISAPCAGMTRIRFDGRDLSDPLSARRTGSRASPVVHTTPRV
jgi:hypothetical protein